MRNKLFCNNSILHIMQYVCIFTISGCLYYIIEILYRGRSHWLMFFLAGVAGLFISGLNNIFSYDMDFIIQILISGNFITATEYFVGQLFNQDYAIWDYRNLHFNIDGQICLIFSLFWMLLSAFFIPILDYIEWRVFCYLPETPPYYVILGKRFNFMKGRDE